MDNQNDRSVVSVSSSSNIPTLPPIAERSPSKSQVLQTPIATVENGVFTPKSTKQVVGELHSMHLESRLSSLEQANRSLLEELVRLHSELKTESRRQEDVTAGARTDLAGLQHELGDLRNDLKAVIDRVTVDLLKRDEQLSNTLTYMKVCAALISCQCVRQGYIQLANVCSS